jgi:hypothetical protein
VFCYVICYNKLVVSCLGLGGSRYLLLEVTRKREKEDRRQCASIEHGRVSESLGSVSTVCSNQSGIKKRDGYTGRGGIYTVKSKK